MHNPIARDDRVLPETHLLAWFVSPFLIAAAYILLGFPDQTGALFAWPIKPPMTAMMLGSAYLGGLYFFIRVGLARQWHTLKAGFLPVAGFATLLALATVLHWDRFTPGHISFIAWAGVYFVAPFLVVAVWLRNRHTDPLTPAPGEQSDPELSALAAAHDWHRRDTFRIMHVSLPRIYRSVLAVETISAHRAGHRRHAAPGWG